VESGVDYRKYLQNSIFFIHRALSEGRLQLALTLICSPFSADSNGRATGWSTRRNRLLN